MANPPPPANSVTPPGWYPDNQGNQRWWNGSAWTEQVQEANTTAFGAAPPPPHAGVGPGPQAPGTKLWYQKKRWWAVGAVLLLFIIGAATGGSSADTDPAASEPQAESQNEPKGDSEAVAKADAEAKAAAEAEAKAEKAKAAVAKAKAAKAKAAAASVKTEAGAMLKEFEGNEAAADAKYQGKVVQVTGHVAKVDTEFFNDEKYVVRLDGGGDFAILSVNCNDVSADQAAKVQADSRVTVRGEFDDGGDLGVELKDCKVL